MGEVIPFRPLEPVTTAQLHAVSDAAIARINIEAGPVGVSSFGLAEIQQLSSTATWSRSTRPNPLTPLREARDLGSKDPARLGGAR
jgi:hypothetical protein